MTKFKLMIEMVIVFSLLLVLCWMIKSYPYQYNYFDLTFRKYFLNNFEVNYWLIENSETIKYIFKIDKRQKNLVKSSYNEACINILSEKDKNRFVIDSSFSDEIEHFKYDYIISRDKNKILENEYKEIKNQKSDGIRLYTIYKHK